MAYNGRQDRYQQAQYPQGQQNYAAQNDYDYNQRPAPYNGYRERNDEDRGNYQRDAFADNQQYGQSYRTAQSQGLDIRQPHTAVNEHSAYYGDLQEQQFGQPQPYNYDNRFRDNGHSQQQFDDLEPPPKGRRSPQSRPGTSASSRRIKQERILDSVGFDVPKAGGWDNPFGVFPGTKKDAEQKKKATEETRSKSRTETPADRPDPAFATQRPPTSAGTRDARAAAGNRIPDDRRPHTSHSRRPQSLEDNPTLLHGLSSDGPFGPADDVPPGQKRTSGSRNPRNSFGTQNQRPLAETMMSSSNLAIRPPPHRSATGSQPLSPTALSTPQGSHMRAPYEQGRYYNQNTESSLETRQGDVSRTGYGSVVPEARTNSHWDGRNNHVPQPVERASEDYGGRREAHRNEPRDVSNEYNDRDDHGGLVYGSVKASKSMTDLNESPMPNFADMPVDATENIERQVNRQSRTLNQPYRKPTYGDNSSRPPPRGQTSQRTPVRPGLVDSHNDPSQSQFDFGISDQPRQYTPPARHDSQPGLETSHNPQATYRDPRSQQGSTQDRSQFPPRMGSRPQVQSQNSSNGFKHTYNQPMQASQPLQPQNLPYRGPPGAGRGNQPDRRPPRQEYGFDEQGYPSNDNYNQSPRTDDRGYRQPPNQQDPYAQRQPPLTRSQTEPVHQSYDDQYEQENRHYGPPSRTQTFELGHDQYVPNTTQGRRPPQQQAGQGYDTNNYPVSARPRTANSARVPPQGYAGQEMTGFRPANSTLPIADRNHPIPIRPGLMSPAPAPPTPAAVAQAPPVRPQQEVRSQPIVQNRPAVKAPVTIKELNEFREAHRNNPNDDKIGLEFVRKLVEAGNVLANEGGRADAKQTAKNRERYINDAYRIAKKLVSAGSSDAMFFLADCYGTGQLGLEINPKEAFQLYTSAAKMGHAQGAYRVAVCCEMGMDGGGGTRRDHVKAVQFYKKAATLGDGPAMFKMGAILMKGLLGQQPNRREGIQWLKRAAERADAENPHALHELGMIYENATSNDVVIKDERYALELYTRAANLGYKHSQARLGSAYEYGLMGCPIDPQISITWYSKAAAQGEHLAEFALSGWYLTGAPPLLEASDQEAYLWARKAASSGLSKAEYAMGYYTETGIGTAPNVEEAKKWYFRAAAQSDERARTRLEEFKRGAGRKERGRVSRNGVGRQNEGECNVM